MTKLKLYSTQIDGVNMEIVATTSTSKAAKLMNTTSHLLNTYKIDFDMDSEAGEIALGSPEIVFISKIHNEKWYVK